MNIMKLKQAFRRTFLDRGAFGNIKIGGLNKVHFLNKRFRYLLHGKARSFNLIVDIPAWEGKAAQILR